IRVEGTAAGGAVRIEMSGLQQVVDVQIAPALIRSGDAEAVSRMVLLAVNQALENSRKAAADAMGQATDGLDMGALGGLLGGGK
ncbi:MAG: YbaB/EbfC family nucleoid-associated protein, partial [Planctomycetota bacterium]|nr:YbaB/EbfC family nucleoid-associated protein [Planctomycetota bacterium]